MNNPSMAFAQNARRSIQANPKTSAGVGLIIVAIVVVLVIILVVGLWMGGVFSSGSKSSGLILPTPLPPVPQNEGNIAPAPVLVEPAPVVLNEIVNEPKYVSKGCWKDEHKNRMFKNMMITRVPASESNTIVERCAKLVKEKGLKTFGVQGGECWAGGDKDYKQLGSVNCTQLLKDYAQGTGYHYVNHVYEWDNVN